ncbi:MAG: hypothetical protein Solivirus3_3 [Solivirus sp.]|uniref:DRBM domain-containing protein n=1 Tax=Solivirus sp. TaxID=2487772 RepID=A0A3G5AJF7_9VIRU|nr:MAG: hypothetical protein Solivirus3_3 [Solivirus sp.]
MNKRYPSDLQKRYANTVFPNLPNEMIVEILAKTDDESFLHLCRDPEFRSYCSSNSVFSERIYEERSKRRSFTLFGKDLTEFKPKEMSWREFYSKINIDEIDQMYKIARFYADRLYLFTMETREDDTFKTMFRMTHSNHADFRGVGVGESREEANLNAAKALLDELAKAGITFNLNMML